MATTIHLIRHGDRQDYGDASWATKAKELGLVLSDPPLSSIGHQQASEVASALKKITTKVDQILVSPYLRAIQTAVPTARALGKKISLEEGLTETYYNAALIPSAQQRWGYFPEINLDYKSIVTPAITPGASHNGQPCEEYPNEYWARLHRLADGLSKQFVGKEVVCFSHAASVALAAALLSCSLKDIGPFAPCGIFTLKRDAGATEWRLLRSGATNPHVTVNSAKTLPWGFSDKLNEQYLAAFPSAVKKTAVADSVAALAKPSPSGVDSSGGNGKCSQLTTHVLDTSLGKPGMGLKIELQVPEADGWRSVRSGVTNDDGRVANLLTPSESLYPGVYRMLFHTGKYFENVRGVAHFYPIAAVVFQTTDRSHYHVPLLLNPYGYSTYRGS